MELIQISDGLWINPCKVVAVKSPSEDADSCTIVMDGQSAVDGGFLVKRPLSEVISEIDDALEGEE